MKVSVLIPAYNVEKYISQCLESVCRQTHQDLQIVVIDDGSKDGTSTIVSEFADKDNRIEVISRENRGVAQTRNELLDKATGDYVLFVDSDDWIEPDMIATLMEIVVSNDVPLAMCRIKADEFIRTAVDVAPVIWNKEMTLDKFMQHRELTGSLCNKLIRRELFVGIRFRKGIGYGEDAMIVWDIINRIDKMASLPVPLYHYRMNDLSISHQGLTESKMSVIPVWEYISNSASAKINNLTDKAKARYGAEITLLLLDAAKGLPTQNSRERVDVLRKRLKELYPFMLKSRDLSYKFKLFAGMSIYGWSLIRFGYLC